jgi:uncharacterized repeat protein (TIGR02543 family)
MPFNSSSGATPRFTHVAVLAAFAVALSGCHHDRSSAPQPVPKIAVEMTSASFAGLQGGANPSARTVAITNGGNGVLNGLATSTTYAASQASGWLVTALDATTAPATLSLQAVTGSLGPGTYDATLTVSSAAAANSPQTINVSFTVGATYALSVTPAPGDGGTLARSPDQSRYASGTSVSLTATPRTGWQFTGWTGDVVSSANPLVVSMTRSQALVANFQIIPPILSATSSGASINLSWTFVWPCGASNVGCLSSTSDHYELEESTTSATSGFVVLVRTANDVRTSPFTSILSRGVGTYYYRVRALTAYGFSPYSVVKSVVVSAPSALTAYASHDNAIVKSSTDPSDANTVFATNDLAVGCDFAVGPFQSDYICFSTLLRFDGLQAQIAGRSISHAVLQLQPFELAANVGTTYSANAIAASWNPAAVTFNTAPSFFTGSSTSFGPPVTTAVPMEVDVTNIVKNWANGSWANNGIILRDLASSFPSLSLLRTTYFYSLEYFAGASSRPRLVINF